jgi:hypothetical protein
MAGAGAGTARAGEVYTGIGIPGLMLGYAHPLNSSFTLRADFATLGSMSDNRTEEGIRYNVKGKLARTGLFADYFLTGGLRVTAGITFNDAKIDLLARGDGGTINIGGTDYPTSPDDQLRVKVKFPSSTPYIGVGYGHQLSQGWGFVFDLGASVGKAKLSATTSGPNLSQASQADIDRELAELRDGVGKVKALPQLSLGLSYRF